MKNKEIGMEQETKDSRNENALDVFGMNTNYFGNELYNVALFIDYENVYKNLLEEKRNTIRDGFFEKIREWCKKRNRRLVKIAVYCNFDNDDMHDSYHQSLLQSYGVETIHTSNQGKNFADLQITIDVLNAMHMNSNIDEFMIMSNDKDMTPLLTNVRYNKRKVSVITVGDNYNNAICSFADEQISYDDIVSEPVKNLFVETLEDRIRKNLAFQFGKNKANYENLKCREFNFMNLEFFCNMQMKQCSLMLYEVYNCVKNLYENGDLLFFSYIFKGKIWTGICPAEEKTFLKSLSGIYEQNFVQLDMAQMVDEIYEKYLN